MKWSILYLVGGVAIAAVSILSVLSTIREMDEAISGAFYE